MNPADFDPVVTPAAFQFLRIQQGHISKLSHGPKVWHAAYRKQLLDTLEAIDRFIPRPLTSVMDIGGGMGGFDALLNFVQPGLDVTIVDGMKCNPEVGKRDEPYSNSVAAEEFLRENGVARPRLIDWRAAMDKPAAIAGGLPPLDLIISLQAWCFHFPPATYMKFALAASRPGTVWIVDVRIMQRFWASDLFSQERLEPIGEAEGFTDKYTRMAFKVIA